jgi:hypothetical protein
MDQLEKKLKAMAHLMGPREVGTGESRVADYEKFRQHCEEMQSPEWLKVREDVGHSKNSAEE